MYGKNVLRLCPAEMKAAIEHYFKTVVFQAGPMADTYVTDVQQVKGNYDGAGCFEITLECPQEGPKLPPP